MILIAVLIVDVWELPLVLLFPLDITLPVILGGFNWHRIHTCQLS